MTTKQLYSALVWISVGTTATNAQEFDASLKQLVQKAYEKSASVQVNNLKIEQSKIDKQTAQFAYLPKVVLNTTYTRLNDNIEFPDNFQTLLIGTQKLLIKEAAGVPFNTPFPANFPVQPQAIAPIQEKNVLKSNVNVQWTLFSGLRAENMMKAAQIQQSAIQYLSEAEKNAVAQRVADAYDKLGLVIASENALNTSEKFLQEQSRFVENAIKNGLTTPLDRQKLELARKRLDVKRLEVQNNKAVLVEQLRQLTGESTENLTALRPMLRPLTIEAQTAGTSQRAEVKALDAAIKGTTFRQRIERSEYIPKVSAFGQYEILKHDLSLFDPRWYVGVGVRWSVFDGLTANNNARKIALDKKIFETQKRETEELINLSQVKAVSDLETANLKVTMTNEAHTLAQSMFELVQNQYKNGLETMTEVLNMLNEVEKADFDRQQAYYEQRKAAIQLIYTNGKLATSF